MTPHLSQRQRLVTAAIYLVALGGLWYWARLLNLEGERLVFWFSAGLLMVILGRYVVEPYFTRPADAIVNSLTLLLALQGLRDPNRQALFGYHELQIYAGIVLFLAVAAIAFKDNVTPAGQRIGATLYWLVEVFGKSKVMFAVVYALASYSFFLLSGNIPLFNVAVLLGICLVFFDVVGASVQHLSRLIRNIRRRPGTELGTAIGCENPLLYKVEVDHGRLDGKEPHYGDLVAIETAANIGAVGMVVNRKHLLGRSWLSVYILTDQAGGTMRLDLRAKKLVADPRSVFASTNKVFAIDVNEDVDADDRAKILANPLFAFKNSFVGYITRDSNINTVSFIVLRDRDETNREISEGTILKTDIYGQPTLYQVVNGNTREEQLAGFDSHGYTVGIARKLGRYDRVEHELETRKWMPKIYAPFFFGFDGTVSAGRIAQIAADGIGRLPDTDLEIRLKDLDAAVTHNTAILGILGIGKSCLAFELIKKVVAAGVKVICIDITNQYNTPDGLHRYLGSTLLEIDLPDAVRASLKTSKDDTHKLFEGNPQKSGNLADYRAALKADLGTFLAGTTPVKIYNPDIHPVSKGVAFKSTSLEDMTIAEKTRIIAEQLFLRAREAGESPTAKYLLVLEEAHSLVPERSSVANPGDDNAANGTAKVILQGRKYGLGSLIITQRTANVSKTILNQCNTMFALRVFDDTGKAFLQNYIGGDYADTLPTLEERHAIAIGRGLRLKQPVIVQLNDRSHFTPPAPEALASADPQPPVSQTQGTVE